MNHQSNQLTYKKYLIPLIIITSLFFLWGFARAILDVLNKHLQNNMHISLTQSALIQVTTYLGYFLMALPAGTYISKHGYRVGVVTGLLIFALGAFLFIPLGAIGNYYYYLISLFVIGCGLVFLEISANPYVTELDLLPLPQADSIWLSHSMVWAVFLLHSLWVSSFSAMVVEAVLSFLTPYWAL